jgi:hypothetical protein
VAEGTSLLRMRTGNCTVGSNPTLSASDLWLSCLGRRTSSESLDQGLGQPAAFELEGTQLPMTIRGALSAAQWKIPLAALAE